MINDLNGKAPILSVFGGKITTYRSLAEHVLKKLKPYFNNMKDPWTSQALLPGGDLGGKNLSEFTGEVKKIYSWLPEKIIQRYVESYGSLMHRVLDKANSISEMGCHFGGGLYEKEVRYLIEREWAQTVDDIIWRRSKLGLFLTEEAIHQLHEYLR